MSRTSNALAEDPTLTDDYPSRCLLPWSIHEGSWIIGSTVISESDTRISVGQRFGCCRSCRRWLGGGQGSRYATSLACENGSPAAWKIIFPRILLTLIFLSGWPCLNYGMQLPVSSSMGDSAQASGVQDQFHIFLFPSACTLGTNLRVSCCISRCCIHVGCRGVERERERAGGGGD